MDKKYAVLEILFPAVRAKILGLLFDPPYKKMYVRELARRSGLTLHTIQEELRRLRAIGLLKTSSNGYQRFYSANARHPLFEHLQRIVRLSRRLAPFRRSAFIRSRRPSKPRRLRRLTGSNQIPNWGIFSKSHGSDRRRSR